MFGAAGVDDEETLRLLAVYADSLRRIAKAEADYYESNIKRRLRAKGSDERQLIELGTQLGDRVVGLLEQVLLMVYRRHREHLWTEHAINHVEQALESSGLQTGVPQPTSHLLCRPDRLQPANRGARRRGRCTGRGAVGRAGERHLATSRWPARQTARGRRDVLLPRAGDGRTCWPRPGRARSCGRSTTSPRRHSHRPSHLTRGDVYGKTVNLAARIASYAHAGQVVVSQEAEQRSGDAQVWFDPLGVVELKGVAKPLPLYQAYRRS